MLDAVLFRRGMLTERRQKLEPESSSIHARQPGQHRITYCQRHKAPSLPCIGPIQPALDLGPHPDNEEPTSKLIWNPWLTRLRRPVSVSRRANESVTAHP